MVPGGVITIEAVLWSHIDGGSRLTSLPLLLIPLLEPSTASSEPAPFIGEPLPSVLEILEVVLPLLLGGAHWALQAPAVLLPAGAPLVSPDGPPIDALGDENRLATWNLGVSAEEERDEEASGLSSIGSMPSLNNDMPASLWAGVARASSLLVLSRLDDCYCQV